MNRRTPVSAGRWKKLIVLSAIFVLFNIFLNNKEPVHDGDSFEYAGIARNILRTGGLREDLLRSYAIVNQQLPHPPSQRANLYVYFLVPFYAVFGDTYWSFLVPSLIGLFLLPLVTYRTGRRIFNNDDIGFYAALITLFLPALLRVYYLADPGLPEVWQMIFYMLFARFLLEERYAAAGLLMGLAYQFRQNSVVLIPAAILWMLFFKRKQLFGAGAVKMFAVAFVIVLPFLIRSWIVFGSPTYNEQVEGASKVYDGTLRDHFEHARMFGVVFNYDAYHNPSARKDGNGPGFASNFAAIVKANMKMALFGKESDILYIPGIFQALGLLMLPFLILGIRAGRGSPVTALLLIVIVLQSIMHIVMITYTDRYILCITPFAFMLCAAGFGEFRSIFANKHPRLADPRFAAGVITFVILTESAGLLIFDISRMAGNPRRNVYTEMQTTCSYIKKHTKPGDVVMTYPFFSTHFICDRYTAPLPYGPMSTVAKVVKKYDAKYFVFATPWRGDRFPDLPFADTVARGMRVNLFKISPSRLDSFLNDYRNYPTGKLNLADYFLSGRFNFEFAPPLYKTISGIFRSIAIGIPVYLALFFVFMFVFLSRPGFPRTASLAVLSIAICVCHFYQMFKTFSPMMNNPPPLSVIESKLTVERFPAEKRYNLSVENTGPAAQDTLKTLGVFFKHSSLSKAPAADITENMAAFVPVPPADSWLSDNADFTNNVKLQKKRLDIQRKIIDKYKNGRKTYPVYGGVFIY